MVDLTPDERKLAASIDAMEKRRALAKTEGDLVTQAEVDEWFKRFGAVIRPLRDKLEDDAWENPN